MASKVLERGASMRRTTLEKIIRGRRGFTLVELGVVVAIVGILAVIAVVGYRKMILSSKMTEAKTMVGAIRLAEEDYKAESGGYLDLSTTYCPKDMTAAANYNTKWAWDPGCGGPTGWQNLPVHADGAVQFGYAVYAGTTVSQPSAVPATLIDVAAYNGAKIPFYIVHAKSDLNATAGLYSEVAGSSFDGRIHTLNEGD